MWKIALLLLVVIVIVNSKVTKKLVCIIGTGVSGLVTTKYMNEYPDEFETVTFEKNSNVGGLWIYTDSTTVDEHGLPVHSSIYKSLRTNGIKAEMIFPDYQNFGGVTSNFTFAKHEEVLQYLRNYTDHFNLRQYIQFNTNVEKIKPLSQLKWRIVTRNLNNNKLSKTTCDAVVVCSGHDSKGHMPKLWGIESFKGRVLHSHVYRKPESFAGQTVVILGGSLSAIDIAVDISSAVKKIYLSHRHDKFDAAFPSNLEETPAVVGAEDGKLVLSNDTKISADTLIFATGYDYHYPFLDKASGIVIEGGKRIHTIYKQMFNIKRPTMAFVNIPARALYYRLAHAQANYIQKVLLGKLSLPSRKLMQFEAQKQLDEQSPGKGPISNFDEFWEYYDEIVHEADGVPLPWWIRPYIEKDVKLIFSDPVHHKNYRLVIHENNRTVEFI